MYLNKITFLIFIFISSEIFAAGVCDEAKWLVEGKMQIFCYEPQFSTWISAKCLGKNCDVKSFLKKSKSLRYTNSKNYGSENPGSKICQHFNGRVLIGRNERGSENAFCQANDGSMVSLSALGRK
jgi:hypothetical protein